MHLLGRNVPDSCAGPLLPGDNAAVGQRCGRMAAHLCDAPTSVRGITCDAPMCEQHRTNVGPDRDYCPLHANLAAKQEQLL